MSIFLRNENFVFLASFTTSTSSHNFLVFSYLFLDNEADSNAWFFFSPLKYQLHQVYHPKTFPRSKAHLYWRHFRWNKVQNLVSYLLPNTSVSIRKLNSHYPWLSFSTVRNLKIQNQLNESEHIFKLSTVTIRGSENCWENWHFFVQIPYCRKYKLTLSSARFYGVILPWGESFTTRKFSKIKKF